jgi:hypothetical protein
MLKKILLAALLLPLLAFGQSYPSPTFNNLTVQGTFTASGKVGLASLASQAANTVVANITGSSASPTAFAMPSCSTANSALQYTSGTGFTCVTNSALTTGTLAQFSATTSAQLAGVISDETGSGSLVFGTNPTISGATITTGSINNTPIGATTANTGKFTTIQATSTITPSSTAGIVGTATNDNANAGSVGELLTNSTTGTSLSSPSASNATSLSLTAGDWDVSGTVQFNPAGTTTVSTIVAGVNTTSATIGALGTSNQIRASFNTGAGQLISTPVVRISVASTTTVFLVAVATFGVSTCTADGAIRARRVR